MEAYSSVQERLRGLWATYWDARGVYPGGRCYNGCVGPENAASRKLKREILQITALIHRHREEIQKLEKEREQQKELTKKIQKLVNELASK